MTTFLLSMGAILILSLVMGAVRIFTGPGSADRMLAVQLFGSSSIGLLLLLCAAGQPAALLDVALVLALLSAFSLLAYAVFTRPEETDG